MKARKFFLLAAACFIVLAVMVIGNLQAPLIRSGKTPAMSSKTADYTPYSDWIEVNYAMTYLSSTTLSVNASFQVKEIKMTGYDITTADDIRNITQGIYTAPILSSLRSAVWNYTKATFQHLYTNCVVNDAQVQLSEPDLAMSYVDANRYAPAIHLWTNIYVTLNARTFFSQEEMDYHHVKYLEPTIDGCLMMGARFDSNVYYMSYPGHNTTFRMNDLYNIYNIDDTKHAVVVGCTIAQSILDGGNVKLNTGQGFVEVKMSNGKGNDYIYAESLMSYKCKANYGVGEERWNGTVTLDMTDFDELKVSRSGVFIHSVKMANVNENLPTNLNELEYVSSDGIRLLYENGIVHMEKVYAYINGSLDKFETDIKAALKLATAPDIKMEWDAKTVTGLSPRYYLADPPAGYSVLGTERPIMGYLWTTNVIDPLIYNNVSAFALTGFLNGGAAFNFNLNIGTNPNIAVDLVPPPYIRLYDRTPLVTNGNRATYHLPAMFNEDVKIHSSLAPYIDTNKALGFVTADITNVNIDGISAVTFDVDITLDGEFYQISSQDLFLKEYLPEGVELNWVTSDILRLAIQEKFITKEELTERMRKILEENLTEFTQGSLTLTATLDDASANFDGDAYGMDGATPVKFTVKGATSFNYGSSSSTAAATTVYSKDVSLKLLGLNSWDVTWKLILPAALVLESGPTATNVEGKISTPTTGKIGDRDYFQITLYDGAKCNVDMTLGVTLNFVVAQFMVCFMIVIVVVILLILGIVALVVTKKRKKKDDQKRRKEIEQREEQERMRDRGYNPDGSRRRPPSGGGYGGGGGGGGHRGSY